MFSKIVFLLHICLSIDCLSTDHPNVHPPSTEYPMLQKLILASTDHQNLVEGTTITDVEGYGPPGPLEESEYLGPAPGQPLEVHVSYHQYPGYGGQFYPGNNGGSYYPGSYGGYGYQYPSYYPGTYGYGYQYPSYYPGLYAKYVKDSTEKQKIARFVMISNQ